MAKYSVYKDVVTSRTNVLKHTTEKFKFLGNADSLEEAYKYCTSKAPSVSYWITKVGFDKMKPDYTMILMNVQWQDGKRWWKGDEATKRTYWYVNYIKEDKHGFPITDSEMKRIVAKYKQ